MLLILPIKLLNHPRWRGKAQSCAPVPCISNRQSKRFISPRVIEIEMKGAIRQRSAVGCRKNLSVCRLGNAQVFLRFLVIWIQAQSFAELHHGLRDLTLSQVQLAQVVISGCLLRIQTEGRQIMGFCLFESASCKKSVGQTKLGIGIIWFELHGSPELADALISLAP